MSPVPDGREASPIRIRRYRSADLPKLRRLWRRSGIHLSPSDTAPEMTRALRRDPDLFLVAERDAQVVGTVLGRFDGRRGWVNHLAVDPGLRSRGVGTRLMTELEDRLRAKGCPKVNLHVTLRNRDVARFYELIGYARSDLIFMEKWLRPARRRSSRARANT